MCALTIDLNTVIALVAAGISAYALLQTYRHKVMERRPWFTVDDTKLWTDNRLYATLKHVSGGIALDLKFQIEIAGISSAETFDASALLPGDTLELRSPLIVGKQIAPDENIKWVFTYRDEFGKRYKIEQVINLKGKQIAYIPEKLKI